MRLRLTLSLLTCFGIAHAQNVSLMIRPSVLAGSQYYALDTAWQEIRVGDRLQLIREPKNRHDRFAIRVEWQGRQLGYVPRAHNRLLAEAMDAGDRLFARIIRLNQHPDPWQRLEFAVYAEL